MIKRKWYERVSAAALAAMLFMNSGGMGVQSRAEILSGENGVVIQEAEGEAQPEANEEEQGLQEEKLEEQWREWGRMIQKKKIQRKNQRKKSLPRKNL